MEIVLLTNIFAVFFAFLESKKILKNGLLISFFIIFIFLSLRYNYGNDYMGYYEGFQEINRYVSFDIFDEYIHFEPGWVVLCILFKPIGFFGLIVFLSFIYCFVMYKLIKEHVPIKLYWFAIVICVFSAGNLLTHLSAMRQALAIVIFIFSLKFIYEKKIILYVASILLASTFHSSALLLLPIYFIQFVNFKLNKFSLGLLFILYGALYFFGEKIKPYLNLIITSFNEEYLVYDEEGVLNSGIGLLINSFFFILILVNDRRYKDERAMFFKLGILSFILAPIGLIVLMFGRINMYFSVFLIVVYPLVFESIKIKSIKYLFLILLFFLIFKTFFDFFESPIWKAKYNEYHSVFEVN